MKYELIELNYLEKRAGFAKFLEIIDCYIRAVSNPNEQMSCIFAMEGHVKFYCEIYHLDFYKLREDLLRDKELNYTEYLSEWNFSNCLSIKRED